MSFDWKGYQALADELCLNHLGGKEAALRTACSRYYYAAFHRVLEHSIGDSNFKPEGNSNDHRLLIAHLEWTNGSIARKLDSLRQLRNKCDYNSLDIATVENSTKYARQLAVQILSAYPDSLAE